MAPYDQSKELVRSNFNSEYSLIRNPLNDLLFLIELLGVSDGFMGFLSTTNKPTAVVDTKQFYIGFNPNSTPVSIDLSAVNLSTLTINQADIYFVCSTASGWQAVNIAAGLVAAITPATNNYNNLSNRPQINGVTLAGNLSPATLSLATVSDLANKISLILNPVDGNVPSIDSAGSLVDSGLSFESLTQKVVYSDATGVIQTDDVLTDACKINKLSPNSLYICAEVVSLDIVDFEVDPSTLESFACRETFVYVDAYDSFTVNLPQTTVADVHNSPILTFRQGEQWLLKFHGHYLETVLIKTFL